MSYSGLIDSVMILFTYPSDIEFWVCPAQVMWKGSILYESFWNFVYQYRSTKHCRRAGPYRKWCTITYTRSHSGSLIIVWINVWLIFSNYWMRLSRIWRIPQIKEAVIHRGRRPRWITPYETCRILHILPKPNSIIALSVKWVKPWSQDWLIAAKAYPSFCSMKQLEVFLLPLDRMLVHRRSLPQQFSATHLYTWVERGTVRVKCLAQEHNTMSPARAQTWTARSGVECANQEATTPPVTYYSSRPAVFIQNISPFLKEFRHFVLCFSAHQKNTTLSPGFLGQRFNNLQRAVLLTLLVQHLVNSSWLWWIMRAVLTNQKWGNIMKE